MSEVEENGGSQSVPEVIVRTEEDAWRLLQQAVDGGGFPESIRLRFDGWPSFRLDVKGRDWNSTVPTRVMPSLLDVQKDINRVYASIQYSEPNLRRLREDEKDDLEIVVKVKKGSSIFNADLWHQFTKMAEAAVGRMNGSEIVLTVVGVALTIAAPVMFKSWLSSRQQQREIDSRLELSREETARLRVMAEAMRQQPVVESARADADATNSKLLKSTKTGDVMEIGGVAVSSEEAREVAQSERDRSQEVQLEGDFAILGNRTDRGDGFRITIRRMSDGLTFGADVPLELPHEQQKTIQEAEWSKNLVWLSLEADMLRDSITRATVVSARSSRKT